MNNETIQPLGKDNHGRRFGREEIAQVLAAFEGAQAFGISQRAFSEREEIPRTTLQYWEKRRSQHKAPPAWVAFFESPDGLEFLHGLMVALQLVMVQMGSCGSRLMCLVLELSRLSYFVAPGYGSQHKVASKMEQRIGEFGHEERERLGKLMQPREITVCQDETFHPEICLVGVEAVSDFILVEEYSEKRDALSWKAAMDKALSALPVTILQSCSDEGKGILGYVGHLMGVHHSPDVFHVQHELHRAFSPRVRARVRAAETRVLEAERELKARRQKKRELLARYRKGALRRIDLAKYESRAQEALDEARTDLESALSLKQRIREAVVGVGQDYHPFDLTTGALKSAAQVERALSGRFEALKAAAEMIELPEHAVERVKKAFRVVEKMVATIAFVHEKIEATLTAAQLTEPKPRAALQRLIGACYLKLAAGKAKSAAERRQLRKTAEGLEREVWYGEQALEAAVPDRRQGLEALALSCAQVFQRSSSCVEGRNGYLELHHRSLHRLSEARLKALTVIHNYFIERSDGTTAAERLFGHKPRDLFEWLLEHMDYPARPAATRRRPASHQLAEA